MGHFAEHTKVPVERSKAEIEKTLRRYGADGFFSAWDDETRRAQIGFRIAGRTVRIGVQMPGQGERNFEKIERQQWRVLLLVVRAKLEAVECGMTTIEREFLADIVMKTGKTVGEWATPQLAKMYKDGKMPQLLLGGEE